MFLGDIHGTNSNTKKFRTDHQTSHCTVIQNILKSGRCYWATCLSARSFAPTAHSLASKLVGQWNVYVLFFKCSYSLCSGSMHLLKGHLI